MDIGELSEKLVDRLLESTADYRPSSKNASRNKRRLGYGIAATIGGVALSNYPIAIGGAAYSALKYYHVRKDMGGR